MLIGGESDRSNCSSANNSGLCIYDIHIYIYNIYIYNIYIYNFSIHNCGVVHVVLRVVLQGGSSTLESTKIKNRSGGGGDQFPSKTLLGNCPGKLCLVFWYETPKKNKYIYIYIYNIYIYIYSEADV